VEPLIERRFAGARVSANSERPGLENFQFDSTGMHE